MAAPRIVLITGGNTGLGLETIKALAGSPQPYSIIVGSRSTAKAAVAIEQVKEAHATTQSKFEALAVDVESDDSIAAAAAQVEQAHGRLDVLINNAGASYDGDAAAGRISVRQAWNRAWDVNVAGTHVLTEALAPLLIKGRDPRLIFVASGTSSLADTTRDGYGLNAPPAAGWPKTNPGNTVFLSYRSAKTGMNMMMRQWERMLRPDGVKVWAVSPGFLATNLGGYTPEQLRERGAIDPAIGGAFMKDVVEGKRDGDVGKVIRRDAVQPW